MRDFIALGIRDKSRTLNKFGIFIQFILARHKEPAVF